MSESPGGSSRDARNGTKYGVPSTRRRGFLSDPREHARQGASADNDRGLMIFFPASERGTMRRRRRRGVRVDDSPPLFLVSVFFLLSCSPSFLPPCTWISSHIGRGARRAADDREELQFTQLARRGYLIICCPLPMTKRSLLPFQVTTVSFLRLLVTLFPPKI